MSVVIDGTTGITAAAFDGAVDAGDLTGTLPSSTLSTYLDPENRIINGAFDFWQRGTSQTAAGYGSADRWFNSISGGTVTMSRQSFTLGDTLGSNSPTFFLRHSVSGQSLTTQYAVAEHRIEGVRSYAGQTITVLGWARRSSGAGNMAIEPLQNFGTGGSPSTEVTGTGQTVTLSGSWAAFAVTISVPSVAGKTLGTNGNDYLSLLFWTSAGSTFNTRSASLGLQTIGVDLWGIHIKRGTHTTSAVDLYRQPELGPELARCQRYYETTDTEVKFDGNLGGTPVSVGYMAFFTTKKRGTPTISIVSQSGTNSNAIASTTAKSFNGIYYILEWTSGASIVARARAAIFSADAEL